MSVIEEAAATVDSAVVAHYQLVGPLMEQIFGRVPIVWTTLNPQPNQTPIYHGKYFGHYSHLTSEHVQHLASIGAQEFHSWCPIVEDPERAHFARFLLERPWADTQGALLESVRRGAPIIRDVLKAEGYDAIPVLDGVGGVSIFVPLSGGPSYPDVRLWAHAIARKAIVAYPELFSEAHNVLDDGRVHIHVSSNATGLFSILPYSVRTTGTRVATPVTWDELQTFDMWGVALNDFRERFSVAGDVFSGLLSQTQAHRLPTSPAKSMLSKSSARRAPIIDAVTQILLDGKTRTAEEILEEAHRRNLLSGHTAATLYTALTQYIERCRGRGRKAPFVLTPDRKFRINEPPDPWPDSASAHSAHAVDIDALVDRLRKTALDGGVSTEFEIAVCDAFGALGFVATHVGGNEAPDGYADAPLGTMGYRVMIECKSGTPTHGNPNVYEAAKYKEDYHAQYCALVADDIGHSQRETLDEMRTHGVCLWGVDDLEFALRHKLTPLELQPAFAPGAIAEDVLTDVLYQRDHGPSKRVRIISDIIHATGWTTQCAAAQAGSPADSPLLTEDAAMLLVDQELAAQGAHVNCTREEVRLAFEWLTNPLNGAAVWNAEKTAIIVVQQPGHPI